MQHSHVKTWTPIPGESEKKPKLRVMGGAVSMYIYIYLFFIVFISNIINIYYYDYFDYYDDYYYL